MGATLKLKTEIKQWILVAEKPSDLMKMIKPLVDEVREKGQEADRCIRFCRTYNDNSEIFQLLILELESPGVLLMSNESASGEKVRVCEKFTACSSPNNKKIIASFTNPVGTVRIVVATVAFGMGLDAPKVRHIIHWGPPEDLELYYMFRSVAMGVVTISCQLLLCTIARRTLL